MGGLPAPKAVSGTVCVANAAGPVSFHHVSCMANGLECTDLCCLQDYANRCDDNNVVPDDEDDYDDEKLRWQVRSLLMKISCRL